MAQMIADFVSWINSTFGTSFEVSASIGSAEYYLALGIVAAFFLFIGLFFAGTLGNRPRLSVLIGGAVAALCLGLIIEQYTGLIDWITLGLEFTDLAASVFTIGLIAFVAVIGWNALRTKGDKLVL